MTRGIAIETQSMESRLKVTLNGSDLEDSKTECSTHASISSIEGFPVAGQVPQAYIHRRQKPQIISKEILLNLQPPTNAEDCKHSLGPWSETAVPSIDMLAIFRPGVANLQPNRAMGLHLRITDAVRRGISSNPAL